MSKNNETSDKKLTFWSFLNDYSIEIPVIQRDYAQGRDDKEALRRNFLASLKGALDKAVKNDDGSKNGDLLLDFIYGSTPEEDEKIYHPLDGQQRLTTLWLLHWYIALQANRLNEGCPESSEICGRLRKFTYETRVSSREFCRELCDPKKFKSFDGIKAKIAEFIKSQTWFHSSWEQDPTISAMLTMLGGSGESKNDGIEEVFNEVEDFESYWKCLTNDLACPIKFLHQPLHHFGLSDDLYVKMNARGKPLTSFECFKADLIGYIDERVKEEKVKEERDKGEKVGWEKFVKLNTQLTNDDSDKADVPLEIKLDTDWTDIFWKNKSGDNRIDDIYFTFLNRFFINYRIRDLSSGDEYYKYFEKDTAIVYSSLDDYKWTIRGGEDKGIEIDLFEGLSTILNNYYKFQIRKGKEDLKSFFKCPWGIPFEFIPSYRSVDKTNNREDVVPLGFIPACGNKGESFSIEVKMIQRVVFYAVCKYFKEGKADEKSLKRWMRFVWNLVSVRDLVNDKDRMEMKTTDYINDFEKAKEAIDIINQIDSHNAYKSLCDTKIEMKHTDTVLCDRFEEEVEKARQIEEERIEEEVIKEAEIYSFFQGGIGFLFRGEKGSWDWESFPQKWGSVQKYFKAVVTNGKSSNDNLICLKENNACLLRTLISFFSSEADGPAKWDNSSITLRGSSGHDGCGKPLYNNMASTWWYLLNNKAIYGAVHRLLMGDGLEKIERGEEGSNQRVLWMLSQTRLLDYVITEVKYPLRYRLSDIFEAFFNIGPRIRILMDSYDKNMTFEESLKSRGGIGGIDLHALYSKGHFICQERVKEGWSDYKILIPETGKRLPISKYLEDYPEVKKTDYDS